MCRRAELRAGDCHVRIAKRDRARAADFGPGVVKTTARRQTIIADTAIELRPLRHRIV